MSRILTGAGKEYTVKNGFAGSGFVIGLYNDQTDNIQDNEDLADITTQPTGAAYDYQAAALEAADNGNWHGRADAKLTFDVSDSSETVDSYFIAKSFQSVEKGDGAPALHLLATGALSKSRDLSQIDALELPVGSVGVELS